MTFYQSVTLSCLKSEIQIQIEEKEKRNLFFSALMPSILMQWDFVRFC